MAKSGFGCREQIRLLVWQVANDLGTTNNTKVARELVKRVEQLAGDDVCAEETMARWLHEGARREADRVFKQDDQGTATVSSTGQILRVTQRVSVAERSGTGRPDGTYNMRLFYEIPWSELVAFIERFLANLQANLARYNALYDLLLLRKKYPNTLNAAEACALEGIDPRDFKLPDDFVV